jgi:hypothetical protein
MKTLAVPAELRERLGHAASDSLIDMFADAHTTATASCEDRLALEVSTLRLDIANLRAELLKWSFLFWIGQLAAITGLIGILMTHRT